MHFLNVFKPGIVLGNIFSFLFGFFLCSNNVIQWRLLFFGVFGIIFVVSSSCILNNYIDRDIDLLMNRTKNRFFCSCNKLETFFTILLSFIFFFLGMYIFLNFLSLICSLLVLLGFIFYVFFYTVLSKRKTAYSILIGGVAGSIPPVVGYLLVSKIFNISCFFLFFLFYIWQIPHVYSIYIFRYNDYRLANLPVFFIHQDIDNIKFFMQFSIFILFLINTFFFLHNDINFLYYYYSSSLYFLWFFFSVFFCDIFSIVLWSRIMLYFSIFSIFLNNFLFFLFFFLLKFKNIVLNLVF